MSFVSEFKAKREAAAHFQAGINASYALSPNAERVAHELKSYVAELHASHPQYAGHFDDYVLVRVNRGSLTKAGVAFKAGDVAIGKFRPSFLPGFSRWVIFSVRNGVDTEIENYSIEEL